MGHWIFNEEHEMFRKSVRKFVEKEMTPHVEEWEKAGEVPRELYRRMGEMGYLGIKFPEAYGGLGLDYLTEAVLMEELTRCGANGVQAALGAHIGIALTNIWKFGSEEQKRKYLVPGIKGQIITALAITEPNGGSDVSAIQTTAKKEGGYYVLNGAKTFITNGVNADYAIVAAKTANGPVHKNISLFIVDTKSEGYAVGRKLKKLGWRSSDTGEIFFDGVKVPEENLIGEENLGFYYIMQNFQYERITMALCSVVLAEMALEAAMKYSKERIQFDRPIAEHHAAP